MPDTLVLPFAERLLGCLCVALADTIAGPPCQCSLYPGTAPPPADACCACTAGNGQAAVQITEIFPVIAGKFPARGIVGQLDNCAAYEWAAELTMTVYRCVATVTEDGFPSVEELMADARKIADDARAMRQALLCCDWRPDVNLPDDLRPIVPGSWKPVNPLGGCAGGTQSVIVLVGASCCPPVSP